MAISKTLVKMKATEGLTSDEVLTRINQDLSVDNPSLMFVTLFLGILNTPRDEGMFNGFALFHAETFHDG